jgi:hypothetical protein
VIPLFAFLTFLGFNQATTANPQVINLNVSVSNIYIPAAIFISGLFYLIPVAVTLWRKPAKV